MNSSTNFAKLFDEVEPNTVQSEHGEEFTEEEETLLNQLESQVKE